MATAYGAYYTGAGYNAFRARMDYSVGSETDTTAVVSVASKCQMGSGHDSGSNFSATRDIGGNTNTVAGSGYFSAGGTYSMGSSAHTRTITKTHSKQSITVKVTVTSTCAWSGHSSTASATVSIPALTSYAVTYDANTGSGAPGSQTKWYGEALTLSAATPTLAGYDFVGWSATQYQPGTGTATYTAGGSYTANSAATLYAVWSRAYIAPKISSLSVYRCNSSGVAADNDEYCYVKCSWSVDTTLTINNEGQALAIEYKASSASSWTAAQPVSLSTASDDTETMVFKASGVVETFDPEKTYNVRVTVSDTSGQDGNVASRTATLSPAFFILDFRPGDKDHAGVGIGHAADVDKCVHLGMKLRMANVDMQVFDTDMPPVTDAPASSTLGRGLAFYGPDSATFGRLRTAHFASGDRGIELTAQRELNGTEVSNFLRLFLSSSNTAGVSVSNAEAWRNAFGETSWANLTLASGVTAYDSDSTPKYRRIVGSMVAVSGAVKPTSQVAAGDSVNIGTLPSGYRPPRYVCCLCQGTGNAVWLLGIEPTGVMSCSRYRNGASNAAITTSNWLTFHFTFAL